MTNDDLGNWILAFAMLGLAVVILLCIKPREDGR